MTRTLCVILMTVVGIMPPVWRLDMQEAKAIAHEQHKHILLNFSGSDWCGPCIMLRKTIFDDPVFSNFADSALVLVNADFPRMKKDQLSKKQQDMNDRLADQYNPQGKFPLTLLLDENGQLIKEWEGNPGIAPAVFCDQLRVLVTPNRK